VVSLFDSKAWTDLELPLAWHNLGVGSGDLDASVEATFVVQVCNSSTIANISTD